MDHFPAVAASGHDVVAAFAAVAALLRDGHGTVAAFVYETEVVSDLMDGSVEDARVGSRRARVIRSSCPTSDRVHICD